MKEDIVIPEPKLSKLLFADARIAWLWLLVRLYVGWQWLSAGWEKVRNPAWVGAHAGSALTGFLQGAVAKAAGAHPDVQGWYAFFLNHAVIPHAAIFSVMVAFGELLVGVALVLGVFTGIAAFFGCFMNMNYLMAGTVSTNPVLAFLGLFLVLAWRVAGWYGLDRFLLPALGTPWHRGNLFRT